MIEMFEKLQFYLTVPFVKNALVVGILISLCAGLIGIPLVLRRFSFIGDSLSHSAFGSLAVASVLKITSPMFFVLPATLVFSALIFYASSKRKENSEAAVALVSSGTLGIGYLLMNLFAKSSNISGDVCTVLFGSTSILTLKKSEVLLSVFLCVFAIALFAVFFNRIFLYTFDSDFASAFGGKVFLYNLCFSLFIGVIIVVAMNFVGSLLVSALLIFPPLSSMKVCKTFKGVALCSSLVSVFCSVAGLFVSILAGTPVGSTIVAAEVSVFIIFLFLGKILCRR